MRNVFGFENGLCLSWATQSVRVATFHCMWAAIIILNDSRADDLTRIATHEISLGCCIIEDLTGEGQVLATLRETDDTERMMRTDRVLWPRARMDIQHTMMEQVHVGLVEEGSWNKPEVEPRVAIIAKRSGYYTMLACVPLPNQILIQRPEFESSNGEPAPLARGMDYDRLGIYSQWRRMDTTDMSSTTRKESGLVQDSGAQKFHGPHPECWQPTQGSGRSSREQECRRAGVGWVLHRRSCRDNCRTAWTSPKGVLAKVFVLLEEVPSFRDL